MSERLPADYWELPENQELGERVVAAMKLWKLDCILSNPENKKKDPKLYAEFEALLPAAMAKLKEIDEKYSKKA